LLEPTTAGLRPRLGPIIRDVAIIFLLTFIGGFVIGFAGGGRTPRTMAAVAISNMSLGTVGFTISGCLAVGKRWNHLAFVALGVWLIGLMNIEIAGISFWQWVFSSIFVAIMMGLGGALSYAFKRGD